MANSSDWMEALQGSAQQPDVTSAGTSPAWMEALLAQGEFVEGLPISRTHLPEAVARPEPAPFTPEPLDPVADAYSRGEAAGRMAAQAEYDAERECQRGLRLTFRNLDQTAMDSLASELAETVLTLCAKSLADFVPEPEILHNRCKEASKRLGAAAKECALHLHPDDIALLDPGMLEQWRVVGDDSIARGGLHFEGPNGSISDGPSDWHRAIAAALRG